MITLTGLDQIAAFNTQLELELARLDREITATFVGWTRKVFIELVKGTPQWTGDLASAWNYSVSAPNQAYAAIPNKVENQQHWSKADVYQRGEEPAVSFAISKMMQITPTSWRDAIYFHNPAPIAEKVENLQVMIRPVNLVNGHIAMVQHIYDKYSSAGGTL